jgi:hypothetical protein
MDIAVPSYFNAGLLEITCSKGGRFSFHLCGAYSKIIVYNSFYEVSI